VLAVEANRSDLRSASKPVTKSLSGLAAGMARNNTNHYYRVEVTQPVDWKAALTCSTNNAPDLYVARGVIPTTTAYLRRATASTNNLVALSSGESVPGVYYIGVFGGALPTAGVYYKLTTEVLQVQDMVWDPGLAHEGTAVVARTNGAAQDYYFRIITSNPAVGAWRTALHVNGQDGGVYMGRGFLPTPSTNSFASSQTGSAGMVLALGSQFQPGEEWYILVRVNGSGDLRLTSGTPYVQDLGALAAGSESGSGTVTIGPEGIRYFKTQVSSDVLAWRLWLNGGQNRIVIKKSVVPTLVGNAAEASQTAQMLLVPPYLSASLFFVGVIGTPGSVISLESRQQPVSDIPYNFAVNTNLAGYGYATYRVNVPANQIAWQIYLPGADGNPHVAVRRGSVPNETANDAISELTTTNADNVTLVPPGLSDGTFFITVYSTNQVELNRPGGLAYSLQEGTPVITDIPYRGQIVNDDPSRSGWRFYKVSNLDQQMNSLGWNLALSNANPGTRIALRRANVPSTWGLRNPTPATLNYYDVLSTGSYLQRPEHEPDTWYIGIYNPTNILGPFVLTTDDLAPKALADNSPTPQLGHLQGRWEYFYVELRAEDVSGANAIVGWDIRLKNVAGGMPKIVVRKDKLPVSVTSTFQGNTATSWPQGGQWAATQDWTKRSLNADGTVNEDGRVLTMPVGRPLIPGTYYVGIYNSGTNSGDYALLSRWIGVGRAIYVTDLAYNGGLASSSLDPREAAYYRVTVPTGSPSWKCQLDATTGDSMLVVTTGFLPGSLSEKRMQKPGDEYYLRLPDSGATTLPETVYYIAAVSEGLEPLAGRVGTNTSSFEMRSLGPLQEVDLGTLAQTDLLFTNRLAAGDTIAVRFHPVQGTWGFWSVLEDIVGNPWQVLSSGDEIPEPGLTMGGARDTYGTEGGDTGSYAASPSSISSANAADTETVVLKARVDGTEWFDASYVLRIRPVVVQNLAFDGGHGVITNGEPFYGNFFVVEVPENALGWDIRVTNVTSGFPRVYVCKDTVPLGPWAWGSADPLDKSTWAAGAWIDAWLDWTERPYSAEGGFEAGQILMVSKGRPLFTPGRYFIQVVDESHSDPVNCTLLSRGVAPNMSIPIVPLAFSGGLNTVESLPPREAAYFEIVVPTNAASWKIRLSETQGESLMGVLRDRPPNIGMDYKKNTKTEAGRRMHRRGEETFLLLPPPGRDTLEGGTYYASVVSEGMSSGDDQNIGTNSSSFRILSLGEAQRFSFGTVGPDVTELAHTNSLIGGDTEIFEFSAAPGTMVAEVRLETKEGFPGMIGRAGSRVPDPTPAVGKLPIDYYGLEGGDNTGAISSTNLLSFANPSGLHTVIVKARLETNATYVIRVRTYAITAPPITLLPLGFDITDPAGPSSLYTTGHVAKTWVYYQIEVPTNTAGWDVRLQNIVGGAPKLVVRRGSLPTALSTTPWTSPGNVTTWPTNSQWAPGQDWTKRSAGLDGSNEDGRILAVGMGRPLEAGIYFVGVYNNGTNACDYTILSRGIGAGFSIPIVDLPMGASITNLSLAAREAAYYRVVIPSNAPSWKLQLNINTNIGGECMITGLRGALPNFTTIAGTALASGKTMQKPGNEQFVLLPVSGATNLGASTNFFAVVGEGKNPTTGRIGSGDTGYVLTSEPRLSIADMGLVTSEDLAQSDALQAGEVKAYKFTVFPGTYGFKIKLENRAGNPVATLIPGGKLPNPGAAVSGAAAEAYGNEGGLTPVDGNANIITLANATPGNYLVLVKARSSGAIFPDASYTLRISEILCPQLNFSQELNTNGLRNTASAVLENNERIFYRFDIPSDLHGAPIIGWKLNLEQSSGLATMRARKDFLPQDSLSPLMGWASSSAVIAPPYLTNGTWYVEVRGSNATAFSLTSEALRLERPAWVMPAPGQSNPSPGVAAPCFADTAVGTDGQALEESVFIEEGAMHYYAVLVPSNNIGLLRTELRSSSGNPDLYLRSGFVPSLQHAINGDVGTIYDRSMTAARDTEYANWVPLSGRTETAIQPGLWYLVVKAASGSNARYRLLLSAGNVVDLTLNGQLLTNQIALGGDWLFYKLTIPEELPASLGVVFQREFGDGVLYMRDGLPPGNGTTPLAANIRDWKTDAKNSGPYPFFNAQGEYTLNAPPLRPGETMFFGVQATSRSIVGLRVTNYVQEAYLPDVIEFYGGTASFDLDPGASAIFKVAVPADAARWRHMSVHTTNIVMTLDQGTVPGTNWAWRGNGANTTLNKPMLAWDAAASRYVPGAWPWVPGQNFFFKVTNNGLVTESVSISMDGRNPATDDNDNNGLPDGWELLYFGSTGQSGSADSDHDAVVNMDEYIEGTNPSDGSSFNARVYIIASGGVVITYPDFMSYPLGTEVVLTAFPDDGFAFSSWGQDVSGRQNPKSVVLNGHKMITALFRLAGDDFLSAIPMEGQSFSIAARNVGCTREPGEPFHAGNYGGRSMWWKWTAPVNGTVAISTEGSAFNTLLGVYRATTVPVDQFSFSAVGITLVASDNNGGGVPAQRSRLTFQGVAGQQYHIAVDGFDGASANILLSLSQTAAVVRPVLSQCQVSRGAVFISITGSGNQTYTVEYSSDLETWVEAGSVTLDATGHGSHQDSAPAPGMRFYRLRQ
jgi:hypothetical protein